MPVSPSPLIQQLETLRALSERMLALAEQLDWSAAEICQHERAALIARLPAPLPALTAGETEHARTLLGQIQSLDQAILDLATPSREHLSGLLAGLPAAPSPRA